MRRPSAAGPAAAARPAAVSFGAPLCARRFLAPPHCRSLTPAPPPNPVPTRPTNPTGKYLLLKDPGKEVLRIYAIPSDAFTKEADGAAEDEAAAERAVMNA